MADEETAPESVNPPERAEEDPEAAVPARRRWPAVTAVAAAVALIAGGVYGAQSLGGSDDGGDGGGSGDAAAPLVLDGYADGQRDAAAADAESFTVELNAYAGTLRASGELPEGPETATDYRFDGGPTREQAADLAAVLGVDGTVQDGGGAWIVTSPDADGPALSALRGAPGMWSYAQGATMTGPADPDAAVGSDVAQKPVDDTAPVDVAPPPSEAEAIAAVEPLLDELGLSGAPVNASETESNTRIVWATPEVDGLPVAGLETRLAVGPAGELVSGWGAWVPEVTAGEERETIGAMEALDAYNKRGANTELPAEPQCGAGDAADAAEGAEIAPVPPEDGDYLEAPRPEPCGEAANPEPVDVTAEFGLALNYSGDEALLVPSWLFHATERQELGLPVSYPAVPFEIGSPSGGDAGSDPGAGSGAGSDGDVAVEPAEPGTGADGAGPVQRDEPAEEPGQGGGSGVEDRGMSVETHDASGRTLTLHFWGGVCDDYTATAEESGEEIAVRVEPSNPDPERLCVMAAERRTAEVTLSEPVGDRTVVDWNGQEIPVR
ncbi:hypothetical protein [Streptomyces sp. 6N223]|uniref:hypothetical protein n=1 Tax=Streptomyces sp. 6N223 TaxID=3457412 RepID=UPI003FD07438